MRNTKTLSISIPPAQLKEMEKVAKEENRTLSELLREAWRRYKAEREMDAVNAYGRAKAAELGITEADVIPLIHQLRKEQREKTIKQPAR